MGNRIKIIYFDDNDLALHVHSENIKFVWKHELKESVEIRGYKNLVEKNPNKDEIELKEVGIFDLVLLDIYWIVDEKTTEHGIEIAKKIRKVYPELPIVIFSEYANTKLFAPLAILRVSGFLYKNGDCTIYPHILSDIISRKFEDHAGQVLYKNLRLLKSEAKSWESDAINEAATAIWRQDNYHGKWVEFWEVITNKILGRKGIYKPFKNLLDSFKNNDLINLGVLPSMRGHLQHVLHVYFTGYIISHKLKSFKTVFIKSIKNLLGDKYDETKHEHYWDLFQYAWLTCATLHDTAYSLEILPDFQDRLKNVSSTFKFAEFNQKIEDLTNLSINWEDPGANFAKSSFQNILIRLHGDEFPASWIIDNATFKSGKHTKLNHGVCSGISFLGILYNYKENLKSQEDLMIFLQWAATAMALHSLKHCGKLTGKGIHFKKDPLSFLLILCDELQIWNRERPDVNIYESDYQLVDLEKLEIVDDSITCLIKYIPFIKASPKEIEEHTTKLVAKIEEDEIILHKYLIPDPLNIHIQFSIQGTDTELHNINLS